MSQTLLAIDDVSLPLRKNVCLYLSKPTVRLEPVLTPSPADSNAPDNLAAHFYGTVLHDAGRFRMWGGKHDETCRDLSGPVETYREVSTGIDRSRQQPKDNPNELR